MPLLDCDLQALKDVFSAGRPLERIDADALQPDLLFVFIDQFVSVDAKRGGRFVQRRHFRRCDDGWRLGQVVLCGGENVQPRHVQAAGFRLQQIRHDFQIIRIARDFEDFVDVLPACRAAELRIDGDRLYLLVAVVFEFENQMAVVPILPAMLDGDGADARRQPQGRWTIGRRKIETAIDHDMFVLLNGLQTQEKRVAILLQADGFRCFPILLFAEIHREQRFRFLRVAEQRQENADGRENVKSIMESHIDSCQKN